MDTLNSSADNDVFIQPTDESIQNLNEKEKVPKRMKIKEKRRTASNSSSQNGTTKLRTTKRLSSVPQPLHSVSKNHDLGFTSTSQLSEGVDSYDEGDDYRDHVAQYLEKLNMKGEGEDDDDQSDHDQAVAPKEEDIDHDEQLIMGTGTTTKTVPLVLENNQKKMILERRLMREDEINIVGTLDLSSLNVVDSDMSRISDQLFREGRRKCTRLILRDNALGSNGVKILVDKLIRISPDLRYLGLSGNKNIGDKGIEHLARLLRVNRSITLLALHNTGITDDAVQIFADLLCTDSNADRPGTILQKLYIPFNRLITDKSLVILRQIIEQNQTLNVLSIQHCSLSNIARKRLKELAKKRRHLRLTV